MFFRLRRKVYLLAPLGRGARGDDSCLGGVVNGGLWWPEETSKVVGDCVTVAVTVSVASPESMDGKLASRVSLR